MAYGFSSVSGYDLAGNRTTFTDEGVRTTTYEYDEVRDKVCDKVFDKVRDEVHDNVHDKVHDEVFDEVRDKVRDKVRDEVCDKVHDEVRDKVRDRLFLSRNAGQAYGNDRFKGDLSYGRAPVWLGRSSAPADKRSRATRLARA